MKHLKHMLAATLAVFLAFVLAVPAFAADTGSITINPQTGAQGTNKASYEYYELLHASIDGNKVSYYLTNGADDDLRALLDAVTVNGSDLFTFTKSADGTRWIATINKKADNTDYTDSDGADIAAALNTTAIKNAALAHNTFAQNNGTAKAEGLEKGYYLVTSTLGTSLVLQTLNDVTIETKNEEYTSGKTASKTNMNVGDLVEYTVTVNVPATANVGDVVTVHDTLDQHLDYKANTIAAVYGDSNTPVTLADGTLKAGETFAKKFTVTSDMIGKTVKITYKAELLSTALDDNGYVNDAYADTPTYETVPTQVEVHTFDFDLDKNFQGFATGDDASKFSATFELQDADGNVIKFVTDSTVPTKYTKADSTNLSSAVAVITIDQDDQVNVKGLAAGTYKLYEKTTSDGYNLLTDPIEITITDTTENGTISHTVSYKIGTEQGTGTVTVLNQSGTVLPSTGGIGTTILYVVGGILVVGGCVALVTKRRMASIEK